MKTNYEVLETITGNKIIKTNNENGSISFIPEDEANSDYQAYLEHSTENPTEDVE